jgi:hypothetical protein
VGDMTERKNLFMSSLTRTIAICHIFNTTRRKRLIYTPLSNLSSNHGAVVDGLIRTVLPCHKWNPIQQDIAQRPRRAAVQCYRPRWQRELESP